MKLLNTLLPLWKFRYSCCILTTLVFLLASTFPSYSQCDINIFQRGTLTSGSVSLMPWLSYTSGCEISNECGQTTNLVVWDMEDVNPCDDQIPKPLIENCNVDVGTSSKSSMAYFAKGQGTSDFALAIAKGQTTRFKTVFKPKEGQSGQVSHLIFDVKSITDQDEIFCDEKLSLTEGVENSYSITILSRGKQMYMGLKTVSEIWEKEIIDIDFISEDENLYAENDPLELEVIISNFTTTGNSVLGLDNLILEGKECLFQDNLAYKWSTGETTERIYSIEKGNYCVTVTDCNGCQAVDCISVN